jgi:dimethylargininase
MLKAITRAVSRNITRCELTFRQRERVDYERAVFQHEAYCNLLRHCGAEVVTLEASDDHPDCCFVADTAVILDEAAIIASMGAPSRRGEIPAIEEILSTPQQAFRLPQSAALDGGDVIVIGKQIFVGRSRRTNAEGVDALTRIVRTFGYKVTPVVIEGSLHLTTACSALNEETVLLNSRWIDPAPFSRYWVLNVPENEPWAASTLRVGATICVEAGAPRTLELVSKHCADVEVSDISEFRKAEGSLPCLSIIYRDSSPDRGNQNKEVTHAK